MSKLTNNDSGNPDLHGYPDEKEPTDEQLLAWGRKLQADLDALIEETKQLTHGEKNGY